MNLFDQQSPILDGLNEAQRYAVTLGQGPILVVAGAGTGKTRTLVHRVAWLAENGVDPGAILLLTFTRRAAEEMLSRAHGLSPACARVQGGTFHSLCLRLLRTHPAQAGLPSAFSLIDTADSEQIIKGVVEERALKERGDKRFPRARSINDIFSRARNLEISLEEAIDMRAPHLMVYSGELAAAAQGYAQVKKDQALLDYDDLLFVTEAMLREDAGLRVGLQARWQHILVDEYQDTNAVQARLVEMLGAAHQNVMAVGDDAQSIYAFRGARIQNIFEFPQRFKDTRIVKLEENYRSTQAILDLSNAVIAQAEERYEKHLFTNRLKGPRPGLVRTRDASGQSRRVVREIQDLLDQGVDPGEIAVLFRAGRDSFDLEARLTAAQITYTKFGGRRFTELAHVKDVMAHLRVIANPRDFLSWQRILTLLPGIGPVSAGKIIAHLIDEGPEADFPARLAHSPQAARFARLAALSQLLSSLAAQAAQVPAALQLVLDYYEPLCKERFEDHPRRLADLEELPSMAVAAENLDDFLGEAVIGPPEADGLGAVPPSPPITLSTIHSAKGKEWERVFIIWAVDGRIPNFAAFEDEAALAEERRLFYVACTRAARGLTLLAPREHYQDGGGWRRLEPSRFVEHLDPELMDQEEAGPVFKVPSPMGQTPASRGTKRQDRPYTVGAMVTHSKFGLGKVMGYKGKSKIFVHFKRFGLKTLVLEFADLKAVETP